MSRDDLRRFVASAPAEALDEFWAEVDADPVGDNFDLIQMAQTSLYEAMVAYGGGGLPRALSLRFSGPAVEGRMPQEAVADLLDAFHHEVRGAAAPKTLPQRLQLDLVGFSQGSAVLQLAPRPIPEPSPAETGVAPPVDVLDTALRIIVSLHTTAELQQDLRQFSEYVDLIKAFARLSDALDKHGLNFDMTWSARTGERRTASLTRRGREHVRSYLAREEVSEVKEVIGRVTAMDLSGKFSIKTAGRKSRRYDIQVDGERELLGLHLNLGRTIAVRIHSKQFVTRLGPVGTPTHQLITILPDDHLT
ncbi:MAG TPA: hypothetical protein VIS06_21515 [Mycobacteriales bacterium]